MPKRFIATIQVLVESDAEIGASDALSEFLTESVQDDHIADWEFLSVGDQQLSPTETVLERFRGTPDPEEP